MNSFVVGIDIGEKESVATYKAPDGDVVEQFNFPTYVKRDTVI